MICITKYGIITKIQKGVTKALRQFRTASCAHFDLLGQSTELRS